MIISAHMNPILKISTVKKNEDVKTLQKFYDHAESHFRISSTLRIQMKRHGTIMLEKLSLEVKLVTASNIKEDTWDLAKVLVLINLELRAREMCTVLDKTEDGKNSANFDSQFPCTGSSLHLRSHKSYFELRNLSQPGGNIKCIFLAVIIAHTNVASFQILRLGRNF